MDKAKYFPGFIIRSNNKLLTSLLSLNICFIMLIENIRNGKLKPQNTAGRLLTGPEIVQLDHIKFYWLKQVKVNKVFLKILWLAVKVCIFHGNLR